MNPYNIIEIENFGLDTDLIKGYLKIEKDLFDDEEGESETIKQLIVLYDGHQLTLDDPEDIILNYIRSKVRKKKISKEDLKDLEDTSEEQINSKNEESSEKSNGSNSHSNKTKPIKRGW